MPDDAQNILSPVQVDNSIKANAWEAFNSAKNENELGVRLQGMNLPQDTKAQLWEAKKKAAGLQVPDAAAQAQARFQPGGAGAGAVQYTPTRKFEMNVAKGFGLDPEKLAAAESSGGNLAALGNIGSQYATGAAAALPGALETLAKDPLRAITGPIDAMASNIVKPTGLPDTGSIFSRKGYTRPNPGQLMGALGGTEAVGNVGEGIGEGVGKVSSAIGKQIAKLSGETPERIAALKALPQQEAAINQRISQAEVQSRTAFKAAYPKIDESPVNLQETRTVAQQAAEQLKAYPSPRTLSQVSDIPMPTEGQVARQIAPETWHPETILDRLGKFDNVPFREAQQYRTAIEQYISKSRPPAAVYNALKNVSNSLESGLEQTAAREGVLPQYQNANAMFKQHAADFWNKGAPLKPFANIPPDATGATVNKFLQTAQQGRALEALERRLGPQPDLRAILAKGSKAVKVDFRDAATLKNLGEPVLNKQVATVNQAKALKYGAAGLGISGGLYELLRGLRSPKAQTPPQK